MIDLAYSIHPTSRPGLPRAALVYPLLSSPASADGYHRVTTRKALTTPAASNQGAACFSADVCAHHEALGCASERVSGHQANIHPALNASERTTTRVPGFEPGTFGFLDRCDGDARRDVSVDKHDSDQEQYTTGGARTSLHTLGGHGSPAGPTGEPMGHATGTSPQSHCRPAGV